MFKLILKNTLRHKLRSGLTILGMAVAILAFALLRTVIDMWYLGIEMAVPNRLVTRHAVSIIYPLPVHYKQTILSMPGVEKISYAHWFAGVYVDERQSQFPQFAVEADTWFDLFPELTLPPEQKEAFLRERNAAVVGIKLARQKGWKVGDVIQMRGTIYPGEWEFVIRGIYRAVRQPADETWFVFHWRYLEERLRRVEPMMAGNVGWYEIWITDPDRSGEISRAIDERFANSTAETITETESAFMMEFASMTEAILVAMKIVSMVIIVIILAVLANTMAMSARERLSEYATLKTFGFRARHLFLIISGESLLLAVPGGILGVLLSLPAAGAFARIVAETAGPVFPAFQVSEATMAACLLIVVGVGLAATAFPIQQAVSLKIAEALRRLG